MPKKTVKGGAGKGPRSVKVSTRATPPKSPRKKESLVLVTGAYGFSGTHMIRFLLEEGYKRIRATDLERASKDPKSLMIQRELGLNLKREGVEFIPADLTQKKTLKNVLKEVDILFHPASLYDYSAPMEALERVNIHGTKNLCETALECGVRRMIHWSTAGVYGHPYMPRSFLNPGRAIYEFVDGIFFRPWRGDPEYKRPQKYPTNQPFTEESSNPLNTPEDQPDGTYLVNDYSITKWKQEQIIYRFYKEKGLRVTIIRPAPLYGPGSDYGIGGIVIALSEGMMLFLPRDLNNYLMVNCHVRDGVRAALFLSQRDDAVGEAYNVIDDSVITQGEFLKAASVLVGRKIHFLPLLRMTALMHPGIWSSRLVRWLEHQFPRYHRLRIWEESSARYISSSYMISNQKLKSLGFQWEFSDFKRGLKDMVEWFIKAGWIK